jgi:hypothetical protein
MTFLLYRKPQRKDVMKRQMFAATFALAMLGDVR